MFDHIQTDGSFKRYTKEVSEASLLVFQAWVDEPAASTTELINLFGSAVGGRTLGDLSAEILTHFQDYDAYTSLVVDTADVDTELMDWLSRGMMFDALPSLSGDETLQFSTFLSVEFDVMVPGGGPQRLSAPG